MQMAQDTNNMEVYAEAIGEDRDPAQFINIALYYEGRRNFLAAGKYFILAQRYKKVKSFKDSLTFFTLSFYFKSSCLKTFKLKYFPNALLWLCIL